MENEEWTREENNFFENLLAILNLDEPKSWEKIAAQVPGKTVEQVQKHYEALVEDLKLIESGSFPLPHYREEKEGFSKEVMGYGEETEGMKKETKVMKKDIREGTEGMRKDDGEGTQVNDHQQRKKGTPWTEDEHRLFLAGLKHYGKGDWRSISRNYIKSRTPTQVASHAQKYFIRRNSSRTKERRRPSIHDITGANGSAHVTRINSNAAELASNNQICIVGHATQGQAPNIQMGGRRAQVYLSGPMSNQYKYNGILENLHPPDHHQSMVSGSYQPSSTMDTMGSDYVHGPSVHSPSNHQSTMHMRRAGPSHSSASNHQLRMHKRTER
ncbi:transcription factor DIVARICATA-like protein [Cinnamomum micranthum f. kanehirae]|uniref:Transcription factor DIVARICATA-like protein n=1 Tax=Cinnamomum micranthum f. kanehirae TaxID=337451 RepID=A0A3S3MRX9_9MAGN|nr:transcription factor DIVARICATA-like protein [Cinnamomum micranthum f. kanehirae]